MTVPDPHFFGRGKTCKCPAAAERNAIVGRQGRGKIIGAVCVTVYIRIGSLLDPGLVVTKLFIH
jgi:hypothetical protein